VEGLGLWVRGLEFWGSGSGLKFQGSGFGVYGLWFRI
jgi:hypothetical protein